MIIAVADREDGRTGRGVLCRTVERGSEFEYTIRMSKNINVNPGQYKVAGRERQGENIIHSKQRQQLAKRKGQRRKNEAPRKHER